MREEEKIKETGKEREKTMEKAKKEKVKEEVSRLAVKLGVPGVTIVAMKATMLEIAEEDQKMK